jgi:hypothetical protein
MVVLGLDEIIALDVRNERRIFCPLPLHFLHVSFAQNFIIKVSYGAAGYKGGDPDASSGSRGA